MHGNYHNTTAVFEYTTKTEKQTENGKCVILILPLLKTFFIFIKLRIRPQKIKPIPNDYSIISLTNISQCNYVS